MGRKLLVSFDTDRIKEYVFATGKLKEIRGASAILDELNRWDMVEKGKEFHAEQIYANGGSGMFTVPETCAEAFVQAVEKEYRLRTLTSSITSAVTELPDGFTNQCDVQPYLQTLAYRLRLKKDKNALHQPILTHPFLRTCDSCGEQYASQSVTTPEPELLCRSCKNKRDKTDQIQKEIEPVISGEAKEYLEYKLWHRLLYELAVAPVCYPMAGKERPEDFGDLGEMSDPKNYMGLIYADGDSMGKVLEQLDNLDEVKKFSEVVDGAIYQAVHEAILAYLPPGDKYFPFDILMLGGDDLVMLTTADKALEVSMKITERFSQLTEKCLCKPLTLSVGVAIAHTKFPFSSLLELAEQALKFSKKEAAKRKRHRQETVTEGLVNFIVVNNSNSLSFDDYYSDTLSEEDQNQNCYRTLRPYNLTNLRYIVNTIRCLKKESFPRGKLKGLQDAVFQSRNQSILEGLRFANSIKDKKQRKIFSDFLERFATNQPHLPFPWFKEGDDYYTPFLDLVELYDFITEEDRR